ncbi:MAG: hypothetical protein WBP53_01100 [Dokdonella sp.]
MDFSGVAVVVSITDEFGFFVEWGAGLLALPVLAGASFFAGMDGFVAGFLAATTFLPVGFEGLAAFAGGWVTLAGALDFVTTAGFLLAFATFLLATAPFATALGLAAALGLDLATATGFALTAALGLALAAFAAGVTLAFAAGFARTAALADLVPALVF